MVVKNKKLLMMIKKTVYRYQTDKKYYDATTKARSNYVHVCKKMLYYIP
jgi:hypothetical protein